MWRFAGTRGQPSLIALGDRARDKRDWHVAVELYRQALRRNPDNPPIWVQYGHALKESGRRLEAEAAYRRAIVDAPGSADAHLQLGHVLNLDGRREEAKAAYLRALALDPDLADAWRELADLGLDEGQIASARDAVALPTSRRRRPSRITLADRARELGEWAEAAQLYRRALAHDPRNAPIWVQYGHVLRETGEMAGAVAAYRRALSCDQRTADTHLQLGHTLKLQGKTEQAKSAYLRAFVLDPARSDPLIELGHLGWARTALEQLQIMSKAPFGSGGDMLPIVTASQTTSPHRNGSRWSGYFDAEWYVKRYPDVAKSGQDAFEHFLNCGLRDGRRPSAIAAEQAPSVSVTNAKTQCLKAPTFGDEVALFASYSPNRQLKPHVEYYLESLKREGISIILVINHDNGFAENPELLSIVDGLYLREAQGYDFAAWAHVFRLNPRLSSVNRLYLINDSMFGPTNIQALSNLLAKLRINGSDLVGLTESHECWWHLQSYFLAVNRALVSSPAFAMFMSAVVAYANKDDTITQYELGLAPYLISRGFTCGALFQAVDRENPTVLRWKQLLESGFPFLKVSVAEQMFSGVGAGDWQDLLSTHGYDITLAQKTVLELARSRTTLVNKQQATPQSCIMNVLQWEKQIPLEPASVASLIRPIGIFVHIYYEDLADEIAAYLAKIDLPKRIYISTKPEEKKKPILAAFEKCDLAAITEIVTVPDYGTDIAPFLIEASKKFVDHDLCLKIHSKKALNEPPELGEGWRHHLYQELMADAERVRAVVSTMMANPDVGVFIPRHYPRVVPESPSVGSNYAPMKRILQKIDIELLPDQEIEFAVGSMFWFRSLALASLSCLGFDWSDFGHAVDERDGTLAHGMERSFLFFAAKAGLKWAFIPPTRTSALTSHAMSRRQAISLIRESGLFDEAYYCSTNPDIARNGLDPIEHWVDHGHREWRNPSRNFDTEFYLRLMPPQYPNPLVHFILEGKARGLPTKRPWPS